MTFSSFSFGILWFHSWSGKENPKMLDCFFSADGNHHGGNQAISQLRHLRMISRVLRLKTIKGRESRQGFQPCCNSHITSVTPSCFFPMVFLVEVEFNEFIYLQLNISFFMVKWSTVHWSYSFKSWPTQRIRITSNLRKKQRCFWITFFVSTSIHWLFSMRQKVFKQKWPNCNRFH